ncbi:MAG: dethiobiotin synthase [Gammaproteobacteria bacterium]|nr:MAG: dethiobiotin synthase [Gammaproteobacteria bacterium]
MGGGAPGEGGRRAAGPDRPQEEPGVRRDGVFVTGTDTGVGKTLISVALVEALAATGLAVVGMKPVASGCERVGGRLRNADALALQRASSVPLPYEMVNPFAFEPPVSPDEAARRSGRSIDLGHLLEVRDALAEQAGFLVIEGIGGWKVPFDRVHDVAELARRLDYPVLLVVGLRLGCINHARLTVESIRSSGVSLAGWVASQLDPGYEPEGTLATLTGFIGQPPLLAIPWLGAGADTLPPRCRTALGRIVAAQYESI